MKQLDRVAQYVYHFTSTMSYLEANSKCVSSRLLDPTRDAVYLDTLKNSYLYQTANFAAFDAAEATFRSTSGGVEVAAAAAAAKFVAEGGSYFDPATPTTPSSFPTGDLEEMAALGKAIATAAGTVDALTAQFPVVAQQFFGFGYWHRPAYGSHITATSEMSEEAILKAFDTANKASVRTDVTVQNCIVHNMDLFTRLGEPIEACFRAWSTTPIPPELSISDLVYDKNSVLVGIDAQRTAGNNYDAVRHIVF